ncbi:MAG: hypothetical protein AAGF11_19535 [Myxococcota bacterium]
MIHLRRASESEVCPELESIRNAELKRVRKALGEGKALDQKLLGDRYAVARSPLARIQRYKCCYCEGRSQDERWRHVEHFRPKAKVKRNTDEQESDGYWWLTWTWDNLLFCCELCNNAKGTDFPLLPRSKPLLPEQSPPGTERPILIDPAAEDPREHIQFKPYGEHWFPRPRSERGAAMLRAVGLEFELGIARPGLVDEWDDHVRTLRPTVEAIQQAIESNNTEQIQRAWARTREFRFSTGRFVALALDVLDYHFPEHVRQRWSLSLDVLYP